MISAVIIEDNQKNFKHLDSLLSKHHPEIVILGSADCINDGCQLILAIKPDVIFMDVELKDGTAFDILRSVDTGYSQIIFCTAYERYAIQAFKYAALDYLLKPVNPEELDRAIERMKKRIDDQKQDKRLTTLLDYLESQRVPARVVFPVADGFEVVQTNDIIYCEADSNYTVVYCNNRETLVISKSLKDVESLLSSPNFVRIHKSFVVNKLAVKKILYRDSSAVMTTNNKELPISRRRKQLVLEQLSES